MTKSSKNHTPGNTLENQKTVSEPAKNKSMLGGKQTELSLNYLLSENILLSSVLLMFWFL